jgi:hypothetical protein
MPYSQTSEVLMSFFLYLQFQWGAGRMALMLCLEWSHDDVLMSYCGAVMCGGWLVLFGCCSSQQPFPILECALGWLTAASQCRVV